MLAMKKSLTSLPQRRLTARLLALTLTSVLTFAASLSANAKDKPDDGLLPATILQLESARQAAAKYFDVNQAIADGYVDIDVVISHMGRHFLKPSLLDAKFDPAQPELLVYQNNADGSVRLAAVEYAVPTDLSSTAPKGFVGDTDAWFNDTGFQLWTLHAWVYDFNPDGVFSPNNPREPESDEGE